MAERHSAAGRGQQPKTARFRSPRARAEASDVWQGTKPEEASRGQAVFLAAMPHVAFINPIMIVTGRQKPRVRGRIRACLSRFWGCNRAVPPYWAVCGGHFSNNCGFRETLRSLGSHPARGTFCCLLAKRCNFADFASMARFPRQAAALPPFALAATIRPPIGGSFCGKA